jgi:hypothetical protein
MAADPTIAPVPVVGQGATTSGWSDSYAHTVERVSKSGKTAWLRRDKATLMNGANSDAPDKLVCTPGGFAGYMDGTPRYEYAPDPNGKLTKVTLRTIKVKKGSCMYAVKGDEVELHYRWMVSGTATRTSRGGGVTFGVRCERYDYGF